MPRPSPQRPFPQHASPRRPYARRQGRQALPNDEPERPLSNISLLNLKCDLEHEPILEANCLDSFPYPLGQGIGLTAGEFLEIRNWIKGLEFPRQLLPWSVRWVPLAKYVLTKNPGWEASIKYCFIQSAQYYIVRVSLKSIIPTYDSHEHTVLAMHWDASIINSDPPTVKRLVNQLKKLSFSWEAWNIEDQAKPRTQAHGPEHDEFLVAVLKRERLLKEEMATEFGKMNARLNYQIPAQTRDDKRCDRAFTCTNLFLSKQYERGEY